MDTAKRVGAIERNHSESFNQRQKIYKRARKSSGRYLKKPQQSFSKLYGFSEYQYQRVSEQFKKFKTHKAQNGKSSKKNRHLVLLLRNLQKRIPERILEYRNQMKRNVCISFNMSYFNPTESVNLKNHNRHQFFVKLSRNSYFQVESV